MRRLILLLALSAPLSSFADGNNGWQCWQDASDRYRVPVDLLYAISRVESGNKANIISAANTNGTYDIGVMQINSAWLPNLRTYGITREVLLSDPCKNVNIGAWILSTSIAKYGYNWRGIGAYNAFTDSKRMIYARRVVAMYDRVVKERYTIKPDKHDAKNRGAVIARNEPSFGKWVEPSPE